MTRILAVMLMMLWIAPACSTPDQDDWEALMERSAALPKGARAGLAKLAANRFAAGMIINGNKTVVGKLSCNNDDEDEEEFLFTVSALRRCINANWVMTITDCMREWAALTERKWHDKIIARANEAGRGADFLARCDENDFEWSPDWDPGNVEELDERRLTDDQMWRQIIQIPAIQGSPIPPDIAVLLGPASRLFPVLCALTASPDGWGCPSRPDGTVPEPGGSEAGSTGGDW